jgi:hypothetical protein
MEDFLLDTDGDLLLDTNGDFVLGESTTQHQQLLIMTTKGAWKENPLVGVGAMQYLENEDNAGLLNEIRKQFTTDGMTVTKIAYEVTGKLLINAAYKN